MNAWLTPGDNDAIEETFSGFEEFEEFFFGNEAFFLVVNNLFWKDKLWIVTKSTPKVASDRKNDATGASWIVQEGESIYATDEHGRFAELKIKNAKLKILELFYF